ncbi:DUF2290 domain-containing protein [Methylovorus menthalis]|uniref:DUF2290 domain-containing protein n=1 Tax=Methylovorus menthalis TaxID=1002227 RepID=UPI001E2ACF42|nr:DUF2290 domain-containing protein [Methylovorus menthalis]MCB4812023.1 DUF2290 domain-containing protein [Methylovorus menthalis]
MNLAEAKQNLRLIETFLSKKIQSNRIQEDGNEISWTNYKSGIFKNVYYPLEYQWLIDNQQYSLLLNDQSFFQFYYLFEEQGLKMAKLAYYPKPLDTRDTLDDHFHAAESAQDMEENLLAEHLLNVVEEIELKSIYPTNTSHIRFDYDRDVNTHEPAHMQFSGLNDLRIPAGFFPLPYSFIQFIQYSLDKNFIDCHISQSHSRGRQLQPLITNTLMSLTHTI